MGAEAYIHISFGDLAIALLFVAIAAAASRLQRLGLERDISIGTIRTFVQLFTVGYVLQYVFAADRWLPVIAALTIMTAVAGHNAVSRQTGAKTGLMAVMTASIASGSAITLVLVTAAVLKVRPWYKPQYVIPLAGMIIGNSMTGAALAVNRLATELNLRRDQIEAALALGATSREAAAGALSEAVRAAMMPTINSMMTVGLVQLPGMMTGQIISGANPADAVRYQIVVMLMIAGATAITAITVTLGSLAVFFTPAHQLSPRLALGQAWDAWERRRSRG